MKKLCLVEKHGVTVVIHVTFSVLLLVLVQYNISMARIWRTNMLDIVFGRTA